jgi:hypothetical protein
MSFANNKVDLFCGNNSFFLSPQTHISHRVVAVEKIRLSQQTMDIQKISNAQKKTISFYFLSYTRENKKVSR